MTKINDFLVDSDNKIAIMAEELITTFVEDSNQENIDYSFSISKSTGEISKNETNTYFCFDTDVKKQPILDEFKRAFFDEDLSNIQENSIEEQELMENVKDFLTKVCKNITDNYIEELKDTVRKVVLGGKFDEKTVPLERIEVVTIDIADYTSIPESNKYLLKVNKEPEAEVSTDEIIKFVQDREEETRMDINDIFDIEKKAKNLLFEGVSSIEKGRKFLNEITIYFFIDYSVKNNDERIEI